MNAILIRLRIFQNEMLVFMRDPVPRPHIRRVKIAANKIILFKERRLMLKKIILLIILSSLFLPGCKKNTQADKNTTKAILIKGISLDKRSVCINEDVMVSVEAENQNGLNSNLMVFVGDQSGNPAILRFSKPGLKKVNVIVKDITRSEIRSQAVEINVGECQTYEDSLCFSASQTSTNQEIYKFAIGDGSLPSGKYTYKWEFGDGSLLQTGENFVTHDYRQRPQDNCTSSFIVKVTAIDDRKNVYTGRSSISMLNVHYVSRQMGSPSVPVIYGKFLAPEGDGYSAAVAINNIYDYAVDFEEAEISILPCGSTQSQTLYAAAGDILDTTSFPAKTVLNGKLHMSKILVPVSTCSVSVKLTGEWENNTKMSATIHLDIPPTYQTAGAVNLPTVKNQVAIDKLNRAAAILGTGKPITPDDLERLEKEGKI
jgi:hypothetical protein